MLAGYGYEFLDRKALGCGLSCSMSTL